MIFYSQSAGEFRNVDSSVLESGCYAGRDDYKNNPFDQAVHDLGPLPQGQYTMGPLHVIPHLGPAMPLTPAPGNAMFGRYGFFIHLDNPAHPGESSDGCIVCADDPATPGMKKLQRIESLRSSGEDQLTVTA